MLCAASTTTICDIHYAFLYFSEYSLLLQPFLLPKNGLAFDVTGFLISIIKKIHSFPAQGFGLAKQCTQAHSLISQFPHHTLFTPCAARYP